MRKLMTLLTFLVVAGLGPAEAQPKLEKLTMPVPDGLHVFPMYVARGGGFFAREGIEVDWVSVASGPRQIAAVVGGSADLVPIALLQVIKARAEGADVVALGSIFDVYGVKVVLSNEAITQVGITPGMKIDEKVKRLQGLKIGISSPGSSTDTLIRNLLLARGYQPDKVVNLQPLGNGAALLAAFEKKLTDGVVWPAPVPEIIEHRGLGKTVVDPFSGEVPELNGVPYLVMATGRDTIKNKPDLIRRAMRAIANAMEFSAANPAESCKMVRPYFLDVEEPVFNAACETYRKATPRTLAFAKENLDKTLAWMNIGAKTPITAKFEELAVTMP